MAKKTEPVKKRPIQYYASTLFVVIVLILLEIAIIATNVFWVSRSISLVNLILRVLSFFVLLHVINKEYSTAYKLAWCIPILLFPVVGGLAYLIGRSRNYHKKAKIRIKQIDHDIVKSMPVESTEDIALQNNTSKYLQNKGFRQSVGDKITYHPMGDSFFEGILEDLKNAEHFIFLEYFIIQSGEMWDSILEVLKERASKGVDVRILYDGMGCIRTLPRNYPKQLEKYCIKAKQFSAFKPVLSTLQNNRDHRKIAVIDGKVAYTGGINLADEYINAVQRYGVWKDSAIRIEGGAAMGFTRFFLSQWNIKNGDNESDYARYFVSPCAKHTQQTVIPYALSPLDDRSVAKEVYEQIIRSSQKYLYIMTPYFIPGEEILNGLKIAAEGGVDVRLITPHVSDNKLIHIVARSKYKTLLESGVKIYEYTPGFIHSKNMISDDSVSICGSVNMDYRSLYLHFECAALILGQETAIDIKNDFLNTLSVCQEIKMEDTEKIGFFSRIYLALIRAFEPLL